MYLYTLLQSNERYTFVTHLFGRDEIIELQEENYTLLDDKKAVIDESNKDRDRIMKLQERIHLIEKDKEIILKEKNSMIEKLTILQGYYKIL